MNSSSPSLPFSASSEPLPTEPNVDPIDSSHADILRASVLSQGLDRDRAYERHPLVTNKLRLPTTSVKNCYAEIDRAILHRDPGTCYVAEFRVGKTTGIAVIVATLKDTVKDLAVGCIIAKHHKASSEQVFYLDFLESFKHMGARSKSTPILRKRALETVRTQARREQTDRYLLVIDEGQNWGQDEWTFLRDLTNDLIADGLSIITVVFAHPKLVEVIQHLKEKRRTDLVGRFLLSQRTFKGVTSKNDFKSIAQMYDDSSIAEFPKGSGISVSEFFMPKAWKGGWRFVNEVDHIFNAFDSVTLAGEERAMNIGMSWVSSAVRNFFFSQMIHDCVGYQSSKEEWEEAIAGSGYEASLFRDE